MKSYGIITPNGALENTTITSSIDRQDLIEAAKVAGNHDKHIDDVLDGVHRSRLTRRMSEQGASECRYFPKEVA